MEVKKNFIGLCGNHIILPEKNLKKSLLFMAIIHQLSDGMRSQNFKEIRTCFLTRFVVLYRQHSFNTAVDNATLFRPPVAGWAAWLGEE